MAELLHQAINKAASSRSGFSEPSLAAVPSSADDRMKHRVSVQPLAIFARDHNKLLQLKQGKTPSVESFGPDPSIAQRVVTHWWFGATINFAIVVTAILMGVEVECRDVEGLDTMWLTFEYFFTALFAVEAILKIYAFKIDYFVDTWNILDFSIALISVVNCVLPFMGLDGTDLGVAKVFRLLRLFRILRIMKAVPELRMVIEGIVGSMRALGWIMLLLMMIIYMFAILCVEVVGRKESGFAGYDENVIGLHTDWNNYEYFGSVFRSMLSLWSMALLAEWNAWRPVYELQRPTILIFMMLVVVVSFGVVNVIIGVIVERTTESMQVLKDAEDKGVQLDRMQHIRTLGTMVFSKDTDGNGEISLEELKTIVDDPKIMNELVNMDFPSGFHMEDLFIMLNLDGQGDMSRQDFEDGMSRLIFSNQFQKDCLAHLGMGQIKHVLQNVSILQRQMLSSELSSVRSELAAIRDELLAEVRGVRQAVAQVQQSTGCPTRQAAQLWTPSSAEDIAEEFGALSLARRPLTLSPRTSRVQPGPMAEQAHAKRCADELGSDGVTRQVQPAPMAEQAHAERCAKELGSDGVTRRVQPI